MSSNNVQANSAAGPIHNSENSQRGGGDVCEDPSHLYDTENRSKNRVTLKIFSGIIRD